MAQKYDELYHYGITGMRWGVRRYQNKDKSLTPAGRKRYNPNSVRLRIGKKSSGGSENDPDEYETKRRVLVSVNGRPAVTVYKKKRKPIEEIKSAGSAAKKIAKNTKISKIKNSAPGRQKLYKESKNKAESAASKVAQNIKKSASTQSAKKPEYEVKRRTLLSINGKPAVTVYSKKRKSSDGKVKNFIKKFMSKKKG